MFILQPLQKHPLQLCRSRYKKITTKNYFATAGKKQRNMWKRLGPSLHNIIVKFKNTIVSADHSETVCPPAVQNRAVAEYASL